MDVIIKYDIQVAPSLSEIKEMISDGHIKRLPLNTIPPPGWSRITHITSKNGYLVKIRDGEGTLNKPFCYLPIYGVKSCKLNDRQILLLYMMSSGVWCHWSDLKICNKNGKQIQEDAIRQLIKKSFVKKHPKRHLYKITKQGIQALESI